MLNLFKTTAPVLPIKNSVLFPYMLMPLVVSRPSSVSAVEAALAREDKIVAIFTQKDPLVEDPRAEDLFKIGTLGVIKRMIPIEQTLHIAVQGVQRIELLGMTTEQPFLNAAIKPLTEPNDKDPEIEALHRAVLNLAGKIVELSEPEMKVNLNYVISGVKNPLHQVYLLASLLSLDLEKEIAILSAST